MQPTGRAPPGSRTQTNALPRRCAAAITSGARKLAGSNPHTLSGFTAFEADKHANLASFRGSSRIRTDVSPGCSRPRCHFATDPRKTGESNSQNLSVHSLSRGAASPVADLPCRHLESNQPSHRRLLYRQVEVPASVTAWSRKDSNPRRAACRAAVLAAELQDRWRHGTRTRPARVTISRADQ